MIVRARSDQARTDQCHIVRREVYPILSSDELSETIREIGFEPSTLYVQLLQEIGNGGFGPGYGLLGLVGGATDDMGETAVGLYKIFAQSYPKHPTWNWPHGLLPVCHWGCAIYSCIDCTSEEAVVKTWDPNQWEDGTSPTLAIRSTEMPLAEWLENWADGVDLWGKMFPSP